MTTREILEAAKARIDKPQKWTRGVGASEDKKRVCAYIAVEDVWADKSTRLAAIRLLRGSAGRLIAFNDEHKHAEVMALFDRAIEAAS